MVYTCANARAQRAARLVRNRATPAEQHTLASPKRRRRPQPILSELSGIWEAGAGCQSYRFQVVPAALLRASRDG